MGNEKYIKVNSKINDQIKKSFYNWIMNHPQVVQSPIFNYCLKVNIDGHTRLNIVPKLSLQFLMLLFHIILVSEPKYGGLKEAIDADNNINISDSTLCSLLPLQLENVQHDTRSCVVVNVVNLPKVYIPQ